MRKIAEIIENNKSLEDIKNFWEIPKIFEKIRRSFDKQYWNSRVFNLEKFFNKCWKNLTLIY